MHHAYVMHVLQWLRTTSASTAPTWAPTQTIRMDQAEPLCPGRKGLPMHRYKPVRVRRSCNITQQRLGKLPSGSCMRSKGHTSIYQQQQGYQAGTIGDICSAYSLT